MTSDASTTYTWDVRDRLIGLTGLHTASFGYDALGRRRQKAIDGTTTDFVYDGLNPVRQAGGSATVDLLTGTGIDEFLVRTVNATDIRNLLSDVLGSTVALTDPGGTVHTEYTYEPFGAVTTSGLNNGNEFRYTAREDDGVGIYYYRARYYHPSLQRFISEDPLGILGGDVNLYAYVGNNPLNWTDPWGLSRGDWWDVRTYTPDLGRARVIAAEVLAETQRNFPGSPLHNDAADAWRHARWSSRMVNEIGWGTAVTAGYGHELENLYEQWQAGRPIAWSEMWMDLHNNREGRSGRDAWRLLLEGRLRTRPIGDAVEYGTLRYSAPGLGASGAPALSGRASPADMRTHRTEIVAVLSIVGVLMLFGCSEAGSKLYITGDREAVGAEIHLDGKRVGIMERRIYSGPAPTEAELRARAEGQRRLGLAPTPPMKPGDVFAEGIAASDKPAGSGAHDQVRAPAGPHEIAFVHRDGRRLVKRIEVRNEVYIGVSFSEMRITGGE